MNEELKPCPFCGEPATIEAGWFGCSNTACNVEAGRYGDDGHEAIPAWNHRPIEDALRAEVERLRLTLESEPLASVMKLTNEHYCKRTWRDKPEGYWLAGLAEEVLELTSALVGKHEHTPEVELRQIASIALNWLEMRR